MPNNLNANPYYQAMQGYDDPRNSLEASATLALAFEQARTADALETANLIAYTSLAGRMNPGEFPTTDLQAILNSNMRDIETRLGLA